jgi:formylglycine-generating enzyme required for sulfatase activity
MNPAAGSPQQILDELAEGQPNRKPFEVFGGLRFWMMQIPQGEYWIGGRGSDYNTEKPRHKVNVDRPFYLGQIPVTVGLWEAVEPGYGRGISLDDPTFWKPKTKIGWEDVMGKRPELGWLCKLTEMVSPTLGYHWCLPTEAEWELACRAGTLSEYWNGEDEAGLTAVGWYKENSENHLRRVTEFPSKQAKEHPFGLLHMHGLIWEWCEDPWDKHAYLSKPPNDINVAITKKKEPRHVFRGGSWNIRAGYCRSSYRSWWTPDDQSNVQGFRLCLSPRP